jgi:hypothetical protein
MRFAFLSTVLLAFAALTLACGKGGSTPDASCAPACSTKSCGPDGCGGSCGSCNSSQTCAPTGQCVAASCTPACGTGETCCAGTCCTANEACSTSSFTCQSLCSPTCPVGWYCDVSAAPTYTCKPTLATCGGTTCLTGQACVNGQCACTPSMVTGAVGQTRTYVDDSCIDYGMRCDTATLQCDKPGDMAYCLPATGCQPGLDCIAHIPVKESTGTSVPLYRCSHPCTQFSDCETPYTTCYTTVPSGFDPGVLNHCSWNFCGSSAGPTFAACPAATPTSGTCLPMSPIFWEERSSGAPAINFPYVVTMNACFQGGTANPNGNCDPTSPMNTDAGMSGICPPNYSCVPVNSHDGYCSPLCNTCWNVDGGFGTPVIGCSAGQTCTPFIVGNVFEDLGCQAPTAAPCTNGLCAGTGTCLNNCDVFADGGCPTNVDNRPFGCSPDTLDGVVSTTAGECYGLNADAGPLGSECTYDGMCADRLYCTSDFPNQPDAGSCQQFCDYSVCTNDGGCPSNCPAGLVCSDLTGGQTKNVKVGFCK